jgi:hypothetical protein
MFDCIKRYFKRDTGYSLYVAAMTKAIEDRSLSDSENEELKRIVLEYDLQPERIRDIRYWAFRQVYEEMIADGKLESAERAKINGLIESLSVVRDLAISDQKGHQKAVIMGYLEEGVFPPIEAPPEIRVDEGETFHWAQAAALVKFKKVTRRVDYSGLSYRIKITKGLSYRVGSITPQTVTRETISQEDAGLLWLTDRSISFRGSRKHFEIPLKKVEHIEYDEGLLKVFKSGRENPYLILLHEYEIVLKMASLLL